MGLGCLGLGFRAGSWLVVGVQGFGALTLNPKPQTVPGLPRKLGPARALELNLKHLAGELN